MWQAMLLAADLPPSKQILINGFISVAGQKMSKSLGNVISPSEMVERYGVDGTRYLLMNLGPFGTDMDVTWEKLDAVYTSQLSNGVGNVCSRVAKLCEKTNLIHSPSEIAIPTEFLSALNENNVHDALELTQSLVTQLDHSLAKEKPWTLENAAAHEILKTAIDTLRILGMMLAPFMPKTAAVITAAFNQEKITALSPLFPRIGQ